MRQLGGSQGFGLGVIARALRALWLLSICLCLTIPASAQEGGGAATPGADTVVGTGATVGSIDQTAWQQSVARAEAALAAGRSDSALEGLRADLVRWREAFTEDQSTNAQRIATLSRQLDVLGVAPEDGSESEDIAARRQVLTEQLARLMAPVLAAEEGHSLASGLIAEIDATLRARQTDALVSLGPSPLNPVHWPQALADLTAGAGAEWALLRDNLNTPRLQSRFRENLLLIVPMVLLGLVLVLRGRIWAGGLVRRLRRLPGPMGQVWSFVISLAKVLVPWAGLWLLTQALLQSGFLTGALSAFWSQLPIWGAVVFATRWLCDRLLPDAPGVAIFDLPQDRRRDLRQLAIGLAASVILGLILLRWAEATALSSEARAVIGLAPILLASLFLARMARMVRAHLAPKIEAATDVVPFRQRVAVILCSALLILSAVGPLLAAIGYLNAAEALIYPAATTLAILALLFALQFFVEQAYALATRSEGDPGEALVPALIGVAMVAAALPLLALVWGMRSTDLTEIWSRFLEGLQIGDTRISPSDFLSFAVLFAIGYVITRMLQGALRSSVLPKTRIDQGGQTAIVSGIGYVGITIAAFIAISGAGLDLSSIAIVAGALSVGIGFGLQTIVSNFVSGIILLIERPISEGDWIEVGGQMGYVRDISVRSTRIETFDRTDVIVPNADLVSGTVTNYTRGNTVGRIILTVGVAYGTDTKRVDHILRDIAEAHPMVLAQPAPAVLFQGFGADSLDFEIRAILRDVNWSLTVRSELNHAIAARFAEEGIEIPFAQRDIWLRNPEALRADPTDPTDPPPADQGDRSGDATRPPAPNTPTDIKE